MPTIHTVKSWPQFFSAIERGEKTHELRPNDRGYKVGDMLLLQEWDPETEAYSGREMKIEVTYITSSEMTCAVSDQALHQDYVILSVRRV